MTSKQVSGSVTEVEISNIGGIDEASVTLPPNISILTGRNATNRTSFLEALMAGLGSNHASLKGDADEGFVKLKINDEKYKRTLTRRNGDILFNGDPYLDNPEIADLFAFLLENNEARQAVARGDNLREIIMRPIDTDRIDEEIKTYTQKREDVEAEIERLEELKQDLPTLENKRQTKQKKLESANDRLKSIKAQLNEVDTDVEQSRTRKEKLEEIFQRIRDVRTDLEDLHFDLETERSTLAELRAEREELEETLSETKKPSETTDRLAGQIDELRRRNRAIDDTITELGSVINFNEEMLENDGIGIQSEIQSKSPTGALLNEDKTICWTCGSSVGSDQIEETLDRLRNLRSQKLDERSKIRTQITQLTNERSELESKRREIERSERRLSEIEDEIDATKERITDLETHIEENEAIVKELESEAESIDLEDHEETLELHREANKSELRIDRLESDLEDLGQEITNRENAIEAQEELKAEKEKFTKQLTDLRTRIDRIEENAIEAFNQHMETVLEILDYENIDRIWIERRETEVREGRRKVERTQFDLHIVRVAASGSVYEDSVAHLSESEREVTGLIFALAGYLVHDVSDKLPFIILDSLEAIDSDRISRIIDYFQDYTDCLIAALLPEDAAALPDEFTYVKKIE